MPCVLSSQRTSDGGCILLGKTQGQTPYEHSITNDSNTILIKTDENGNQEWTRVFGGRFHDEANEIQQTSEGGYIFTGYTLSYSLEGIEQEDKQKMSIWLVKLNKNGDKEWMKVFDKEGKGLSVQQKTDGGYIIAGFEGPYQGSSDGHGLLIETDEKGNEKLSKKLNDIEFVEKVIKASDGGYIVVGHPKSIDDGILLLKTFMKDNNPISIPGFRQIPTIFALFCVTNLVKWQRKSR